jgi:hypothetical protein
MDQSEYLGADGLIILKWMNKKSDGGLDWINLAQIGTGSRFFKMVINVRVAENLGNLSII